MRLVPVVFGIDVKDDFPIFFGSFYKFSYYCQKNDWPIIAQDEYFVDVNYYAEKFNVNLEAVAKINEIPSLKSIKLEKLDKYTISQEETNAVIKNYKNIDEAWIKIMNNKDDTLYKILDKLIKQIVTKYNDIKALVVWRHNETISLIAKKYGLDTLEMELSGVRKPSYNFGLCYFQHLNKYSSSELNERYENFIKETKNKKVPLLSRKELLQLLVSKKELENLCETEEYDFGIALGLRNDYDTKAMNAIINEDIMKQVLEIEKGSNILIRKHPANYNYKYKLENRFVLDNSISSIQFLSRCRRIVSSISNIGFEAMLLGKTSYTLGEMPFKRFCYNSLDYNDDFVISNLDLNFLVFCYFVPFDLALEKEYLDFRSKTTSEYDIYMFHYNYILNNHKIYRNNKIKSTREKYLDYNTLRKEGKEKIQKLEKENKDLSEELRMVYSSKSWKITKPLRYVMYKLNGKGKS